MAADQLPAVPLAVQPLWHQIPANMMAAKLSCLLCALRCLGEFDSAVSSSSSGVPTAMARSALNAVQSGIMK